MTNLDVNIEFYPENNDNTARWQVRTKTGEVLYEIFPNGSIMMTNPFEVLGRDGSGTYYKSLFESGGGCVIEVTEVK